MKHWIGFTFLMTLISVLTMGSSCRHLASPTFPPTFTFTPTNTVVGSPTNTFTVTSTATPTNTRTSTFTATITSTPTITFTPTSTITPGGPTFTFTGTPTVTSTFTTTSTPTATATTGASGCVLLLNDASNLTVNGNWTGSNSTISLSGSNGTASSSSVDVDITTGTSSYNDVANLDSFTPALLNATAIIVDLTVDASVTTGAGYCQLALQANTSGTTNQYQVAAATSPANLVGGAQSVTLTLTYGSGYLTSGNTITKLFFNTNEGTGTTGNIYIGDVKVVYPSTCQTIPTPVTADTWTFENISLTNSFGTWVSQGTICTGIGVVNQGQDSSYSMAVSGTWPAQYTSLEAAISPSTPINASGFNGVEAWVYIPTSTLPGGYPGAFVQISDGSTYPESAYFTLDHGGWTYVNMPASAWGGTFNSSNVTFVQVIVQSDGTTPTGSGYFLADNIGFY